MSSIIDSIEDMETALGAQLQRLRLSKGLDQQTVADRAGLSVRAVRRLEAGTGSTLTSLLSVLRVLGREQWLKTIAPLATINPLQLTQDSAVRRRAPRRRAKPVPSGEA